MPTAHHGDAELFFEVFGSAGDPTLLLIVEVYDFGADITITPPT